MVTNETLISAIKEKKVRNSLHAQDPSNKFATEIDPNSLWKEKTWIPLGSNTEQVCNNSKAFHFNRQQSKVEKSSAVGVDKARNPWRNLIVLELLCISIK